MSKYNDLFEYHNKRTNELAKEIQFWRDKAWFAQAEASTNKATIETYEKIIAKLLGDKCSSDDIFMFEGNAYKPVSFSMTRNPDEQETLDVEFVKCNLPFTKKEKRNV